MTGLGGLCARLPPEIWDIIAENLLTPDLYSIAITCSEIHSVALPLLYTDVQPFPADPRAVFRFLKTVIKYPNLAQRVRRVALVCRYDEHLGRSLEADVCVLGRALLKMRNIIDLEIGFLYPWEVLEHCTFRLERLKFTSTDSILPDPVYVVDLLRNQSGLTVFERGIDSEHEGDIEDSIGTLYFPRLRRLVASADALQVLRIENAIPEILMVTPLLSNEELRWLETAQGNIDILSIVLYLPSFLHFPAEVTNVRSLIMNFKIRGDAPHLTPMHIMMFMLFGDWHEGVSRFKNLVSFSLVAMGSIAYTVPEAPGLFGPDDQWRLVYALHTGCPSLTEITLPSLDGDFGVTYRRSEDGLWVDTASLPIRSHHSGSLTELFRLSVFAP